MSQELESRFVKMGLWTNMKDGPVFGKTITTDTRTGNLVIAIVAVVSTLGTAHLWNLLSFAYHQARANGRPADALFRQQQALLRTLPTPSTVMADAMKLMWAWRKKTERPFLRSILLILLALLFTIATVAASVFSSLIVSTGTIDVLVSSPFCGRINTRPEVGRVYDMNVDHVAPVYAAACYKNGSLPSICDVFVQPNIPLKVTDVSCPFADDTWCDTKESVNVDSGLLDVGTTFGINLAPEDRVQVRKATTCSILPNEDNYILRNAVDVAEIVAPRTPFSSEQIMIFFYGTTFGRVLGATLYLSTALRQLSTLTSIADGATFYGNPKLPAEVKQGWMPRDGIRIKNGTGNIYFKPVMLRSILYDSPVDDPLYSAHQKTWESRRGKNLTKYSADYPIRFVTCTQQFQFCHDRQGKNEFCTPLQWLPWMTDIPQSFPEATDMQRAVLQTVIFSNWVTQTVDIKTAKSVSLKISSLAEVTALPADFWKQEVLGREQESWAGMQYTIPRFAIGGEGSDAPGQKEAEGWWIQPKTKGEKTMCASQIMRKSGGFVNINLFGLVFILTFSLLALVVDITLLKFLVYIARFRRHLGPRVERWVQDGVWQLQRRAYEGEGLRDWANLEDEIPLTTKGQMLKDLPILWVPGKSPMVMQTAMFRSTGSQETLVSPDAAVDGEDPERRVRPGSRWYMFGRR